MASERGASGEEAGDGRGELTARGGRVGERGADRLLEVVGFFAVAGEVDDRPGRRAARPGPGCRSPDGSTASTTRASRRLSSAISRVERSNPRRLSTSRTSAGEEIRKRLEQTPQERVVAMVDERERRTLMDTGKPLDPWKPP